MQAIIRSSVEERARAYDPTVHLTVSVLRGWLGRLRSAAVACFTMPYMSDQKDLA